MQFGENFRRTSIKKHHTKFQVVCRQEVTYFFLSIGAKLGIFLRLTISFSSNISKPFKLSRIIETSFRIISPNSWMPAKLEAREKMFLLQRIISTASWNLPPISVLTANAKKHHDKNKYMCECIYPCRKFWSLVKNFCKICLDQIYFHSSMKGQVL